MFLNILQRLEPFQELPVAPVSLNAACGTIFYDYLNRQLRPILPPLVSFVSIFNFRNGCDSFKQSLEEQDHLLVFGGVHSTIIVQHKKTNCNYYVQMWRLEYQKVFILILKYKLIYEWILFEAFELPFKSINFDPCTSISQHLELTISCWLVVGEDEVSQSKVWIAERVWRQAFVVLNFEIASDGFDELDERQGSFGEHIRFRNPNSIILFIFTKAIHDLFETDVVFVFK